MIVFTRRNFLKSTAASAGLRPHYAEWCNRILWGLSNPDKLN